VRTVPGASGVEEHGSDFSIEIRMDASPPAHDGVRSFEMSEAERGRVVFSAIRRAHYNRRAMFRRFRDDALDMTAPFNRS